MSARSTDPRWFERTVMPGDRGAPEGRAAFGARVLGDLDE